MIIKGLVIILLLCEQSFQNPLSPPKLDAVHSTSIPPPLVITNPEEGKDLSSSFMNIWENRFSALSENQRSEEEPKTVLAVEFFKMFNLIPMDAPNPLYVPKYSDLTDRFILESLSTENINFDDPKLLTPEGLTIKTMNGKDLTFKKDRSTGKIQVNGIDVLRHTKVNGNTKIIVISDFLFKIYDDVRAAMKQLLKSYKSPLWVPRPPAIPAVPKVLEGTEYVGIDASGLLNLWKNRLRNLDPTRNSIGEAPKTIVAVDFWKMTNLIPRDAPNPLYSEEYEYLANRFIKDSVSLQSIDINDPKLVSENGISIRSISGRDLTFKKDLKTNKLTINDIEVENNKTFEDGTSVFVISDFLFDHQSEVRSAFDELSKKRAQESAYGFSG